LQEQIKVNRVGVVQVVLVPEGFLQISIVEWFVERILEYVVSVDIVVRTTAIHRRLTIDRMTTHGRSREDSIFTAKLVFPEPELPAMPTMLLSVQGGAYTARSMFLPAHAESL
jgi:hypothetical protein